MEKTVSKEYHRVTDITQPKSNTVGINAMILRNYNDGRHGDWNNYCSYKFEGIGSYVKPHAPDNKKVSQFTASLKK